MPLPPSQSLRAFLGLFICIGLIAVGAGAWNMFRGIRAGYWPTADAVVLTAEMRSHQSQKGGTTYFAEITYKYQVAGTSYTGTRLSYGSMSASSGYAQDILNRYVVGKTVPVHYSPGNPEDAVLEPGVHGGSWVSLGVGTVFVLAGMMFMQFPGKAGTAARPVPAPATAQMNQPPILMGVIFALMGSFVLFAPPSGGTPNWIVYAAGGFFILIGVFILLNRLENKIYSKIPLVLAGVAFLALFHWVAFEAVGHTGAVSTPFSIGSVLNARTPFVLFTALMDLALVAVAVRWIMRRLRD